MKKVITYGTYDLLHYGHINLLKRAKLLGDYLIVGVTADDFDKSRGKVNVQQSLMERVEAIRSTGIADEIIIEEYEGQKIDDIKRKGIDIFTVGSDWKGKFDYLKEYCQVVYLDRTEGISSSDLRTEKRKIKLGLLGEERIVTKFNKESTFVNGLETIILSTKISLKKQLSNIDAIYLVTPPNNHYLEIKHCLEMKKHVLCEMPITLNKKQCEELYELAKQNNCILMNSNKTAYATAYSRMLYVAKGGKIGEIVSVDVTATSLKNNDDVNNAFNGIWNSICAWGPTAMLPIFHLLGTNFKSKTIISKMKNNYFDLFTKINFLYDNAVASIKVGKGVKSEGELIVSGTKGYIFVPAPWWKTDYFEVRYEDSDENKRYFYQLDGEGIRYELVAFLKAINLGKDIDNYVSREISDTISQIIEDFNNKMDFVTIK